MWASTLCPFSSSTRNMALGNGSTTVPSTRIVSSLGLARARSPPSASCAPRRAEGFSRAGCLLRSTHARRPEERPGDRRGGGAGPTDKATRRRANSEIGPRGDGRAARYPRGTGVEPSSGQGEDLGAVVGDCDGVLEVGGPAAVPGDHGPAVVED